MSDGCCEECGVCSACRIASLEVQVEVYRASNGRLTSDLSAERDLKRAAYEKLDQTREVVEKTIIPALEHIPEEVCGALESPTGSTCRQEGPDPMEWCGECRAEARRESALSAARKALED